MKGRGQNKEKINISTHTCMTDRGQGVEKIKIYTHTCMIGGRCRRRDSGRCNARRGACRPGPEGDAGHLMKCGSKSFDEMWMQVIS